MTTNEQNSASEAATTPEFEHKSVLTHTQNSHSEAKLDYEELEMKRLQQKEKMKI